MIFEFTEELTDKNAPSATEVTVEKLLPLNTLEPGQYQLKMKVTDSLKNQSITPTANFTVT